MVEGSGRSLPASSSLGTVAKTFWAENAQVFQLHLLIPVVFVPEGHDNLGTELKAVKVELELLGLSTGCHRAALKPGATALRAPESHRTWQPHPRASEPQPARRLFTGAGRLPSTEESART